MNDKGNTGVRTRAEAGYDALLEGAALVNHPDRTVLRLSGKDPVGMLGAILTNEVPKDENLGVYAALLSPKGRIQTDLRVLKTDGDILGDTEPEGAAAAKEILSRYAPFSRVRIEDLSENDEPWGVLGLYGPRAAELLGGLRLAEHESKELEVGGTPLLAAGVAVPVAGLDLIGPSNTLNTARDYLLGLGATPAAPETYETSRIEAGIPRFGADITPENFPGETGILDRAVSFKKGCYPGQETVARMHYRGHPNKTLHRLVVEGPPPFAGTPILQDEKRIGVVTSIAPLPVQGRTLALGYLSRKTALDAPMRAGDATVSRATDA
jgi:folate-binding protein YgfZ